MRTADFEQTYASLDILVEDIAQMRSDYEQMCKNLESLVNEMDSQWEGEAKAEFKKKYEGIKPKLNQISIVLERYSDQLKKVNRAQAETDSENAVPFRPKGRPDSYF